MSADLFEDEGFGPVEVPDADAELALQDEALDTDRAIVAPTAGPPAVVGRTWRLDLDNHRLTSGGHLPVVIRGEEAMRQAILKAITTDRGSSPVQSPDYGRDAAERDAEGQPFDAAAFAEIEEHVREALLQIPWVLDVQDFDAQGDQSSTEAFVSFRVIPEGTDEPLNFARVPLPTI